MLSGTAPKFFTQLAEKRRERLLASAADGQMELSKARKALREADNALRAHEQRVDRRKYIERRVLEGVTLVFSVAFIFHQMGWI